LWVCIDAGDLVKGDFIAREVYSSIIRGDQLVLVTIRYCRTTDVITVKVLQTLAEGRDFLSFCRRRRLKSLLLSARAVASDSIDEIEVVRTE
jgi:hypothetical protein